MQKTRGIYTKISSHLEGVGCPQCKLSKGENIISKILLKNNIKYKPQYSFPDLKFKKKLYFDFGLLDNNDNLIGLIEFNGEQHYSFYKNFHKNKNNFDISIIKDNLKIGYCKERNIPLYIIKHDENISNKMEDILNIYYNEKK